MLAHICSLKDPFILPHKHYCALTYCRQVSETLGWLRNNGLNESTVRHSFFVLFYRYTNVLRVCRYLKNLSGFVFQGHKIDLETILFSQENWKIYILIGKTHLFTLTILKPCEAYCEKLKKLI